MKDGELVTVIVPVYNLEQYVDRCVDSIVHQTYSNLEILLIDDGSTDLSYKKCMSWACRDERCHVFTKPNGGVSSTRNFGIDRSNGEYIMFVDGDDYISTNMIAMLMQKVEKDSVVACSYYNVCNGEKKPGIGGGMDYSVDNVEAIRRLLNAEGLFTSSWATIIPKEMLATCRFNEGIRISEDFLFVFEVLTKCKKYIHLGDCFYYYTNREGSALHQKRIQEDSLYVKDVILDNVKDEYPCLAEYAERLCITNRISLVNQYFIENRMADCNRIADSLRSEGYNYFRNRQLKIQWKTALIVLQINRYLFCCFVALLFKIFR